MKARLVLLGVATTLAVGLTAPAFGVSNVVSSSAVSAKTTADKALAKAIKANKKAKAAQATADSAQSTANSAQTSATTAKSAADAAQTKANSAAAAAAAAQTTANNALAVANAKFGTVTFKSSAGTTEDQTNKSDSIACPSGQRVVGGGYSLTGNTNAAYVNVNFPYGNNAWFVSANDNSGVNSNWALTVYANCIGS